MKLLKIRKEIDKLDKKLVEILARRMSYIPEVAEYKKQHDLKRRQKDREKEIFENLKNKAAEMGLSPELLKDLFKRIIKESHKIEKKIMKK
jgi:chorismate mutase-like protein